MASDKQLEVVVVVSGQPQPIRINSHQKLEQLVREALHETGNQGQAASGWELRTEDGRLLSLDLRLDEVGLTSGAVLFLNPLAGAGGS
jgi:hypothetical protein